MIHALNPARNTNKMTKGTLMKAPTDRPRNANGSHSNIGPLEWELIWSATYSSAAHSEEVRRSGSDFGDGPEPVGHHSTLRLCALTLASCPWRCKDACMMQWNGWDFAVHAFVCDEVANQKQNESQHHQ
jgi:hypothetical protein